MKSNMDSVIKNSGLEYVGDFTSSHNTTNLITFKWFLSKNKMSNKSGRIYFFIESGQNEKKIIKIGKSNDKQGIKGTIGFYTTTLSGTPSITRFSLHHLIRERLDQGKTISVYVKYVESVKAKVFGLINSKDMEIPLDVTYFEKQYLDDYKEIFGHYPEWNFQESGKKIPSDLIERFSIFIKNKRVKTINS